MFSANYSKQCGPQRTRVASTSSSSSVLRRVSCGQSAWQPKVNAPSLCLSASHALGCVWVRVWEWESVRCINICVNLSFFVVYEYLNLLQCQTMAMKISCDHQRQFCFTPPLFVSLCLSPAGVFAEMWWLLVVQIEIPVLTQFCLSSGREREWKLRNWAEKCESQFCLTTKNVASTEKRERDREWGIKRVGESTLLP